MKAYIKGISTYLPMGVLNNETLAKEFPEWTVDKIAAKVGIRQRHIAAEGEFVSDMAVRAANNLFEEYNFNKTLIDFILLCTQSPDYFLPTTACLIQERLGLSTKVGAIDYNQGCSGYVYGLSLAKGLIVAGIAKNVLLITAETYSKFLHKLDKSNRTIFGDAATASLISTEGDFQIKEFELGSDGKGASNLIVKTGGARYPNKQNRELQDGFKNVISDDHLYMNGSEIFNFTLQTVPHLISDTLQKNNLTIEDIDLFIFHQANKFMLNHLRKKIGIKEEQFVIEMEVWGNTVSSTIPIALKQQLLKKELFNKKIILAGFGVGYSWGGVLIES